jgi:DNA-binding NarL/FixJ family response regulator
VAAIVLSTFDEDDYIFGALRGGAVGYLFKDCSPDDWSRPSCAPVAARPC